MARIRTATAVLLSVVLPAIAHAQAPAQDRGQFLYGLSAGAGSKMAGGTLQSSALPPVVGQPPDSQSVAVIDLSGGVTLARRVGVLALFEQAGGSETASGRWGTLGFHGIVRGWIAPRVWLEAGGGTISLGFRPPSAAGNYNVTRLWAPSLEAAGGIDIFQGSHVTIGAIARYTTATFDGLRLQTFSIQVELLGRH